MSDSRVIFFGTANLACPSLNALSDAGNVRLLAVVTQPDRPQGRHLRLLPSSVKLCAQSLGLKVLQPERVRNPEFIETLRAMDPDLIVVVAYGQILPQELLDVPRFGCVNVHASLLPKYRGAAPVQWALLHGERETGVTLMKMDAGLDTGGILAVESTPIRDDDDACVLHDRLAGIGASLLVRTLPGILDGTVRVTEQPATGASYAAKINREDGLVDWARPAEAIWNQVRALVPWPGAFSHVNLERGKTRIKIWRAAVDRAASARPGEVLKADKQGLIVACGSGSLRLLDLQPDGGRRLAIREFLSGHRVAPGTRLGN